MVRATVEQARTIELSSDDGSCTELGGQDQIPHGQSTDDEDAETVRSQLTTTFVPGRHGRAAFGRRQRAACASSSMVLDLSGDFSAGTDSLASDTSSSSSASLEFDSGASTTDEEEAAHVATTLASLSTPTAFRTPVRSVSVRPAVARTVSSPKASGLDVNGAVVPHDHPLPHPPFEFDILNHAPARNPVPPPGWKPPNQRTAQENIEEAERTTERRNRVQEQRRLRESQRVGWGWRWVRKETMGFGADFSRKGKDRAEERMTDYRSAAFFPHAHLPGLSFMSDVFCVIGDSKIDLVRLEAVSTSSATSMLRKLVSYTSDILPSPERRDREEYFTCAWSVNITTHPYTPMLAVAGRGRTIDVFLVGRRATGEWLLHKDRTITGHGGTIHNLAFHPSFPHLLASASEDKTIRLWDPTLPWGSDITLASERAQQSHSKAQAGSFQKAAAREDMEQGLPQADGGRTSRPSVEGELLGVLAEGGHEKAIVSCDFHATLPLLVSAGNDGFIKLWQLPRDVLAATPYWPDSPLYRHPRAPSFSKHASIMGPPIFSSYAVHPGQWPDQVIFASTTTCTILSKAPVTHAAARFSPRLSAKLWVPTLLDVLPASGGEERAAAADRARSVARAQGPHAVPDLTPPRAPLPPNARGDSGFRIISEAVLESQNCVSDSMGWHRPAPHSFPGAMGGLDEPFFVLGSATPLPVRNPTAENDALYFFRPFAPVQPDPVPTSSTSAAYSKGDASAATRDHRDATSADDAQLDAIARTLFPPFFFRDRVMHDFVPRLRPSAVAAVFLESSSTPEQNCGKEGVHWRALAVSADGTSVVSVGDGGRIALFCGARCGAECNDQTNAVQT